MGVRHCESQVYGVHRRQKRRGRALVGSASRGPPRKDGADEIQLLLSSNQAIPSVLKSSKLQTRKEKKCRDITFL